MFTPEKKETLSDRNDIFKNQPMTDTTMQDES